MQLTAKEQRARRKAQEEVSLRVAREREKLPVSLHLTLPETIPAGRELCLLVYLEPTYTDTEIIVNINARQEGVGFTTIGELRLEPENAFQFFGRVTAQKLYIDHTQRAKMLAEDKQADADPLARASMRSAKGKK